VVIERVGNSRTLGAFWSQNRFVLVIIVVVPMTVVAPVPVAVRIIVVIILAIVLRIIAPVVHRIRVAISGPYIYIKVPVRLGSLR
jgi:hypothetical protein